MRTVVLIRRRTALQYEFGDVVRPGAQVSYLVARYPAQVADYGGGQRYGEIGQQINFCPVAETVEYLPRDQFDLRSQGLHRFGHDGALQNLTEPGVSRWVLEDHPATENFC